MGQTRQNVQKRWAAHWRTATCSRARKAKFQHALVAFGKEAFKVEEVFTAFDATTLNRAEIAVIAELSPVYNSTAGGSGTRAAKVSEATKKARSEAAKKRWANAEWRAKTVDAIKLAAQTPEALERHKKLRTYNGGAERWAGHVKKQHVRRDKATAIKASWVDPAIRERRIAGLKKSAAKPEVRARRVAASMGRVMPLAAVEKSARAKWKPLYCPELQTTFLCGKYAAEYLGVLRTSVANAVKQKGKLLRKYSLEMVA